ncbi:hypothetical protein AK830_g3114 [Neonectria ditissima]|uniref:Zn(2)-C6 fungal-type domain-containing protein n=1 Tax=Neonectria ditissima TaxID=78410 RepID=A0A0P7BRQ5_9HYPO|nr:hypothetical protein AK830_g3114 [Neonectria ditissima]
METQSPLLRRSNGRPQACDPCRARKVACDHSQPTCKRCRKRRQPCVYTVAPKPKPGGSLPRSPCSTPTPPYTGYLGFTSHSAVFEETRNSLTLVHGSRPVDSGPRRGPRVDRSEVPAPLREMILFVLRNLPGTEDFASVERTPCRPDDWLLEAAKRIVQTIHKDFPKQREDDGLLEDWARTICSNTARPFHDTGLSSQDWIDQFAGPCLRWESIGILLTYWDVEFWEGGNAQTTGMCLKYCIEIALHFTPGNDIIVYLCYRRSTMVSIISGDASLSCWSCHSKTVALLTFLGLHAERETTPYRPTLISENRRRLFARLFNIDKVMVSFTGRPPLLGRRYVSTPLPLDLPDEVLLADDESLVARTVQALDDQGWNTEGRLYSATLLRARVMIAFIREELLEVALSVGSPANLSHLQDIKTRQIHTMSQFPVGLIYRHEDLDNPGIGVKTLYSRLLLRLEHLQNLFFVERLMLRLGNPDQGHLLTTSFEMVSLTLVIWTRQDRFAGIRRDFEWLLMAYGAPGGGILCLELLRPTFRTHPDCPKLSRSSIIQQLSLLIGFLDWLLSRAC